MAIQENIGHMRHRVSLEGLISIKGEGGAKQHSYISIAEVWATIRPAHHHPQVRGNKMEYPISHEIIVRYAANYKGARRIVFGGRLFDVRSTINPGERNTFLVFRCEEA